MSFTCPFCSKVCAKTFGLRNHLNGCKKAPEDADLESAYKNATKPVVVEEAEEEAEETPEDADWSQKDSPAKPKEHSMSDRSQSNKNDKGGDKSSGGPFNIGAFFVLADHIPLLIDINFAIALGDHILDTGSDNKAIMAFAHQLKKLDESN